MRKIIGFGLLVAQGALAAQMGNVIVDQASVLEFPQKSAKVITKLKKGMSYPVSNLPTEGYYKIRTTPSETGWISGNDVLVQPGDPKVQEVPAPASSVEGAGVASADSGEEVKPDEFWGASTRIQIGIGLHNLSYGGVSSYVTGTSDLNFGKDYSIELQRKFFYLLYWALRVESMSSDTGLRMISDTTSQQITHSSIPVQLGILIHPVHAKKFRIGLGAYIGASLKTYLNIDQVKSGINYHARYNSIDPVATGTIQATYGLGKAFGIFGELGLRIHQTAEMPAVTELTSPSYVPELKINYFGYVIRGGLEIRL
jgi:hypothetical protein